MRKRDEREAHTIIVNDGSAQFVPLQHREELEGALLVEEVGGLEALRTRDHVVGLDSGPEIWHLKLSLKYLDSKKKANYPDFQD